MKEHFLIDGFNLGFRCFYAMPDLSRADGFPTGALHAFFASLVKLSSMRAPHASSVFFDKGGSERHRSIYPEYKANRLQMPDNMRRQIPAMKELCSLFGFDPYEMEGVEADDLIASAAVKLREADCAVSIVSADKDFAQLISPKIHQLLPPSGKSKEWAELDMVGVRTKFGVSPAQIPDFLALVGDAADNIPGLSGVGPKTAAKWLKEFENIDAIIKRYDWLKPEKFRAIVRDGADILRRNLELVRLDCCVDVALSQQKSPDFQEIIKFLEEMEMKKSIIALRRFAKDVHGVEL